MIWRAIPEADRVAWLTKYASDSLTPDEYRELSTAAAADPGLFRELHVLTPYRLRAQDPAAYWKTVEPSGWRGLWQRITPERRVPVWAGAAACVVLLVLTWLGFARRQYLDLDFGSVTAIHAGQAVRTVLGHPGVKSAQSSGSQELAACSGVVLPSRRPITVEMDGHDRLRVAIEKVEAGDTGFELICGGRTFFYELFYRVLR